MLDMGPDAELGRGKARACNMIAGRPESAEIILAGRYIAAIAEETGFLQGLAESDVRANALTAGLGIVVAHNLLNRAVQLRLRVAAADEGGHLFLRGLGRPHDGGVIVDGVQVERRVVGGWHMEMHSLDCLAVHRPRSCRREHRTARDGAMGGRRGGRGRPGS